MHVFFDTNVLIAALIETHPEHSKAIKWLIKAKNKQITGFISTHSLAELYSTLTRLPIYPKILPQLAHKLVVNNILSSFKVIELTVHLKKVYPPISHLVEVPIDSLF